MTRFSTLTTNRKAAVVIGNVVFFAAFIAKIAFHAPFAPMVGIELAGIAIELMAYYAGNSKLA